MRPQPCRAIKLVSALALLSTPLWTTVAIADTFWVKSLSYENVKVERVDGTDLVFISNSGIEDRKPLASITRIALDDEPALTDAEAAYAAKNFAAATDGYKKAATASSKPWVRQRAAIRLIDSGVQANDFPSAVTGFALLTSIDPGLAAKLKPTIPPGASPSDLSAAARALDNAANASGISEAQQRTMLNYEIELLTAAHDADGASRVLKRLDKTAGAQTGTGSGPEDADVARARVEEKLNAARVAFAQHDYQKASDVLQAASDGITAPDQQDEALFIYAECKEQLAGTDPKALTDAAIAYMRVVANFQQTPGAAHIPESLMAAAKLEERLSKPDEALHLYQEVASKYRNTAFAESASENAARISAALKPKG